MKKELKLDADEKSILDSYEKGEWRPVRGQASELRKHRSYARNTLLKDKRVNIRISSTDLEALQTKAIEEGLPYQTLIASVLHKFVAGRLISK